MKPVEPNNAIPGTRVVFAKDQPEYIPLSAVITSPPNAVVVTQWQPDDAEIECIKNGGHIFLQQMTFGEPLQPVNLQIKKNDESPDLL